MKIRKRICKGKKIFLTIIINMVLLLGGLNIISRSTTEYIRSEYEDKLSTVSDLIGQQIDGDRLNQFIQNNRMESDFYDEINSLLLMVKGKFPEIRAAYIMAETEELNIWRVVLTTDAKSKDKLSDKILEIADEYEVYLGKVSQDNRIHKKKR